MADQRKDDVLDYGDEEDGSVFVSWIWDLVRTWGPALAAVLVIRSAIAEPFRIPSGSMVPTLEIGDHILVSKFSYGLRVPFTQLEILPLGEPERGDVVVFEYPKDPKLDYIKRIVGVPGDTIEVRDNTLFVNGQEASKQFEDDFIFVDDACREEAARLYREDLAGVEHWILNSKTYGMRLGDYGPFTVPEGEYFAMGDNRDNSADSRRWGTVSRPAIKGKAVLIWLSINNCEGDIPILGSFRTERLFQSIE
ncbi:MAG: signal peptidase I [Alphaproteobacteria bacterium]|nr:signal peptidase I [Alphaproteobacteria bacterium]MCB9793552.1 signal peptidase I [Alphaproteobacteria bacterium]